MNGVKGRGVRERSAARRYGGNRKRQIGALLTTSAWGQKQEPDFDFYMDFSSCMTTVGYLALLDEPIKVMEGVPLTMACDKRGGKFFCVFEFKGGGTSQRGSNEETYEISMDSPPLLFLKTANGSGYIAIDTVQNAAVLTNRIVSKQISGSKICHGIYLTAFQYKNMRK